MGHTPRYKIQRFNLTIKSLDNGYLLTNEIGNYTHTENGMFCKDIVEVIQRLRWFEETGKLKEPKKKKRCRYCQYAEEDHIKDINSNNYTHAFSLAEENCTCGTNGPGSNDLCEMRVKHREDS